jgi:hypothetical protein
MNYFNKVEVVSHISKLADTEYMCFIDSDVLILKPFNFLNSEAPVLQVFEIPDGYPEQLTMMVDKKRFDMRYQVNHLYQKYFKHLVIPFYRVESIKHYAMSWIVQAKTKDSFWQEWRDLTVDLVNIVHEHYSDELDLYLEAYCEETALSILYAKNPDRFINSSTVYTTFRLKQKSLFPHTVLYHYGGGTWDKLQERLDHTNHKSAIKEFLDYFVSTKEINNKEYLEIFGNYLNVGKYD